MPVPSTSHFVLIASPGDVKAEREAVRDEVNEFTSLHSRTLQISFVPLMWEINSAPDYGARPQEILNGQLVDQSDLCIAVFGATLGTPTGTHPSGTVEEIERSAAAGKRVMLFFRTGSAPAGVDASQVAGLARFKAEVRDKALYQEFARTEDLRGAVNRALWNYANNSRPSGEVERSPVPPEVELELAYKKVNHRASRPGGNVDHHDYEMTLSILNRSDEIFDDWILDVQFPSKVVPRGLSYADRINSAADTCHIHSKRSQPLLPDKVQEVSFRYYVDQEIYRHSDRYWPMPVKAAVYVGKRRVASIERKFADMQNY